MRILLFFFIIVLFLIGGFIIYFFQPATTITYDVSPLPTSTPILTSTPTNTPTPTKRIILQKNKTAALPTKIVTPSQSQ